MQLGRSLNLHFQSDTGKHRIFTSFTRVRSLCSPEWYHPFSSQRNARKKKHKFENGGRGTRRHWVATEPQELLCWIRLVSTTENVDENVEKQSDVEKVVKLEKCWTLLKSFIRIFSKDDRQNQVLSTPQNTAAVCSWHFFFLRISLNLYANRNPCMHLLATERHVWKQNYFHLRGILRRFAVVFRRVLNAMLSDRYSVHTRALKLFLM
jgi:hypothetical protein